MHRFPYFLSLALIVPMVAQAAETGQITGRVLDPSGNPLVGVEVTLSGESISGEQTQVTGADGRFRFVSVPPGTHGLLLIAGDEYAPVRVEVDVRLDEASFVPITMTTSTTASEEVIVEEALPVIDATRSAFSAEMSDDLLQNLPVGRSYQDAVNMLPGVYGRVDTDQGGPGDGNPSVRGEGQYGNNYMVDGISTRDPATKTFGTNVNFDSIQDIQVYTDGAPAEFGEFAGMIVNVVTKDGGDEHHGTASYYLSTDASGGKYLILDPNQHLEVPTAKRDFLEHSIALTAGGPIVKEKLWYFASLDLGASQQVFEGMNPETPYTGKDAGVLAKLTWFVNPDFTLQYAFNGGYTNLHNEQTSSSYTSASQSQRDQNDGTHLITATFHPDALTEFELKGGRTGSHLDVIPMSNDITVPSILDLTTGQYRDNYTDFDLNKRGRIGGSVSITRVLQHAGGDHKLKAGSEFWLLSDARKVDYTGPDGGRKYQTDHDGLFPCTAGANYTDCDGYTQYRESGFLGHKTQLLSFYLQDDWQPVHPLTLNLGIRVDNEKGFQNSGEQIRVGEMEPELNGDGTPNPDYVAPTVDANGDGVVDAGDYMPYTENDLRSTYNPWMFAPRLGGAWDVTGDSKTLVSGNWGRYYDVSGTDFIQWGDTKSDSYFEQWYSLDSVEHPYDPASGALTQDGYYQAFVQDPAGNPLIYDEKLQPAHMDKLAVSVERELFPLFAVSLRGILSKTANLPEDMDFDLNNWFVVNPDTLCGKDAPATCGKHRDYKALEVTAEKKYDDKWQLLASYTLSSSKGHAPGQFERATGGDFGSNGNNVGVYLDDVNEYDDADQGDHPENPDRKLYFDAGYGWILDGFNGLGTTTNSAGWYGYLPYHALHTMKINGSYTLPDGTTLGLVYELDSGHAWQKRTFVDLYGDYSALGEGRGTRFMPVVNYVDVRAAHKFALENDRSLELTLDVFNLPDLKQSVSVDENDDENFGLTMYRQSPRSVRAGVKFTY
jgi:hypothetical protein